MSKERRLSIWTIVFVVIALILLGWLLYTYFFNPSAGMSEAEFQSKIEGISKDDVYYFLVYRENLSDTGTVVAKFTNSDGKIENISAVFYKLDDIVPKLKEIAPNKLETKVSYPSSFFSVIGSYFPILFYLLFFGFIFFRMNSMGMGLTGSFKGTQLVRSTVSFNDVAGIEEEKRELLEIVDFLRSPQKYIKMGARIPKGLLLFGPPGTGKTLLAKAVSGESNVPFFSVTGSEFEEVLVGMGASRIRDMFKKAKENAPCIIFIDEIDSLGSARNQGISGVKDQTLNQFLAELDGFESNLGVVVIAATNRADVLDPALLRSGRFDRKIQVSLPDVKERKEILKIHSRNKKIDANVNFDSIAGRTPGFSGAQLENSLNEAALLAVRKNKTQIDNQTLDEGIDRVIGGPAKVSKVISDKTRLLVAIHESGHALIGLLVSDALKVQKVTIIPRGSAGGYTITTPKDETFLFSKEALQNQLVGLLAGRGAEEVIFGTTQITTGGHDDFSKATLIAKKMVEQFGMSKSGLRYHSEQSYASGLSGLSVSEYKKKEMDEQIDLILENAFVESKKIVKKEKKLLFLLAESLLVLETITSDDIDYIYKNSKLPTRVLAIKNKNPDKQYLDLSLFNKDKKTSKPSNS